MSTRTKLIFLAVLVALAALLLHWLARPTASHTPTLTASTAIPLKAHETARIQIHASSLVTQTKHSVSARYVPPESKVTVTVEDDGAVDEEINDHGFTFEPGAGIVYSDRPRLAIDCELFYWNRLGFDAGVAASNLRPYISPFVAVSYQLDQLRLDNTSLLVGYTLQKDVLVGIRVSF